MDGFFNGESIPVNDKLSEIFLQLHISEKSGRGVPKITETYGKNAFDFRENSIVVTIPFERLNRNEKKTKDTIEEKTKGLNSHRTRILSEMRDNPNVTADELAKILSISKTAIENNIAFLKKNGYVERIGANKGGYWKILG